MYPISKIKFKSSYYYPALTYKFDLHVGNTQISTEYWAQSEPISKQGDCAVVTLDLKGKIFWKVTNCSETRRFICKNCTYTFFYIFACSVKIN